MAVTTSPFTVTRPERIRASTRRSPPNPHRGSHM